MNDSEKESVDTPAGRLTIGDPVLVTGLSKFAGMVGTVTEFGNNLFAGYARVSLPDFDRLLPVSDLVPTADAPFGAGDDVESARG